MLRVLKASQLPEHFAPHGLGHTYASILLAEGVSPVYVQEQLGHATNKPREVPLNQLALAALRDEVPTIGRDSLLTRWNRQALGVFWRRLCVRAKVHDLHFHDLRHTFATRLQNLGVGLEVRAQLLGHRLRGPQGQDAMTSAYSHGGPGWNAELRRAVILLETSYSFLWNPVSAVMSSSNSLKNWCPQRELYASGY